MCKLNNIMSFMICTLIISIFATPTTTFKTDGASRTRMISRMSTRKYGTDTHRYFPPFQIEIMLGNGFTAPKTGVIV